MSDDKRARLKQWLESGEAALHPLTFSQRELWETSAVPVGDPANHICCLISVRGLLTTRDGEAAVQRVVERQEALRLSFLPGKKQPLQMVRKSSEGNIRFRDLSPAEGRPEAVEELAQEIFREPFDLVQGPLYRAVILRRAADDHVIVFAIHHAIADGWTLGVFVQDLFGAYLQRAMGIADPLPPVPLSYTAWGAAERAFWQPAELEPRAAFWKSTLAGAPRLWTPQSEPVAPGSLLNNGSVARRNADNPVRRCNEDNPVRVSDVRAGLPALLCSVPDVRQALQRWVSYIPLELGAAARDLARRNGATLFSTLLAGFQLTLSQWTGADDFVVGTPVANRTKKAVHETMGYCSSVVPLRARVDRDRAFEESLREVHRATVDCFANAMPFAELVRAVGEMPAPGHHPVFQVRFALQNHPIHDLTLPTLSAKLRMRSTGTARFDLGCEITEQDEALEVAWLFRPSLFSQTDLEDLDRLFQSVLTSVCRSPESRAAALTT